MSPKSKMRNNSNQSEEEGKGGGRRGEERRRGVELSKGEKVRRGNWLERSSRGLSSSSSNSSSSGGGWNSSRQGKLKTKRSGVGPHLARAGPTAGSERESVREKDSR
ncbi:uncharacterized protein BO66DRAFT_21436 [Aspergillus aculeatinus CBS 121060]|uniref:Uncharacterized protein n=1 Tax=Aspergillus aculeatinus CBS 121060 TaxID=1448322 RepID=A0ACD1HH59_9EURO|nr:hypothetical protein BO66DRAFT_21436 [Aspergillus aculeatinus CBS 121060]RAH72799.1 hypothetical protein BO66DRAFT_21436 [Aspergillus aculeatinus CBS 121060]